jgi:hypothetical protein
MPGQMDCTVCSHTSSFINTKPRSKNNCREWLAEVLGDLQTDWGSRTRGKGEWKVACVMNNNRWTSWSLHARTDREACPPGRSVSSATCIPETTVEMKLSETGTISLIAECPNKGNDRCTDLLQYSHMGFWQCSGMRRCGVPWVKADVSEKIKTHSKEIHNVYPSPDIVRAFECTKASKTCHWVRMWHSKYIQNFDHGCQCGENVSQTFALMEIQIPNICKSVIIKCCNKAFG